MPERRIVGAAVSLVIWASLGCGADRSTVDDDPLDADAPSGAAVPDEPNDPRGDDGASDGDGGARDHEAPPKSAGHCLRGQGDFGSDGPYSVATEDVQLDGLGSYTLFYPSELEEACPHPIVAWGNGSTVSGSAAYAHFQKRAASWGIVVIASHNAQPASGAYLKGGLDYLLAENANAESKFHHKLSGRAGVAGHSQGGLAANNTSGHPNVEAIVCIQGGGIPAGDAAFLCQTGVNDPIRGPCTDSYRAAGGPAFLADHATADHLTPIASFGADSDAGKQYVRLYAAWLRCWLDDDPSACALFKGSKDAPVCGDSNWATCESRNF